MDDEAVKAEIIDSVTASHGVHPDVAGEEWEQWHSTMEAQSALDQASVGDIEEAQMQFLDHLNGVGALVVSEAKYRGKSGRGKGSKYMRKVGHAGYPKVTHHVVENPTPLRRGHPLGRRGAYIYRAIGSEFEEGEEEEEEEEEYDDNMDNDEMQRLGLEDDDDDAFFGVVAGDEYDDDNTIDDAEARYEDELFSVAENTMDQQRGDRRRRVAGGYPGNRLSIGNRAGEEEEDADLVDPSATFGVRKSRGAAAERAFLNKMDRGEKIINSKASMRSIGARKADSAADQNDYLDRLVMEADPFLKMQNGRETARRSGRSMSHIGARTPDGHKSLEELERLERAEYDIDDMMMMDSTASSRKSSRSFRSARGGFVDRNNAIPEDLSPAGSNVPFLAEEENAMPIGAQLGEYTFAKTLVAMLRRHRTDATKMETHGNDVGAMLAKRIASLDRSGMSRKRFPETAGQQRYRRNAVVRVLIRLLKAVGSESVGYRDMRLQELADFLQRATSEPYFSPSGADLDEYLGAYEADDGENEEEEEEEYGDLEAIGARTGRISRAARRASRLGRATSKKYGAAANVRDRLAIVSGIVGLVRQYMPPPGSETGMSAATLDFDQAINRYVRRLANVLRKNPGMSTALVDLVVGVVKRFVLAPQFKYVRGGGSTGLSSPEIATLANVGLEEIQRLGVSTSMSPSESRALPPIPGGEGEEMASSRYTAGRHYVPASAAVRGMTTDLMAHAEDYLHRNPTHVDRSQGRLTLFVPENKEVMGKISERLRSGGRASKDEYIVNALAAKHPHKALAKEHLLALSGRLFHVKENATNAVPSVSGGQTKVISQMIRSGSAETSEHDDAWDAEARNAGGPIMSRLDHHKMYCRVGNPIAVSVRGKTGAPQEVSIIPLFYNITGDHGAKQV